MIKIKNNRLSKHRLQQPSGKGSLFHYAHFICDCLFPEILIDIFNYTEVIREETLDQTIGNFNKIYTDVMMIKHTELCSNDFNNLNVNTISYKPKELCCNIISFNKFTNFIFKRYNINNLEYNTNYPEVILVKRGGRIKLIDNAYLSNKNTNITTGKERREINNIDILDHLLNTKYGNKFQSLYFEKIPFEEQIKYFNNAKLIICAHGAVMSNMFFCKEGTTIIEVTCGASYKFFDLISEILKLNHKKCYRNNINDIIKLIS